MSLILSLSRSRTVLTGLGAMLLLQCGHLSAQTLVVGGIDRIMFPVDVVTVGDALATALYSSGYRLAATEEADASRDILMPLPLPDAHRRLGPMPLRLALQTLAGPAWRLLEDPVYRLVAFERCPNFAEVR